MKSFHVADLRASGEIHSTAEYAYEHLEQVPCARELIADLASSLYREPEEFERPLDPRGEMVFRWHSNSSASGNSSLRDRGNLISFGLLVSGLNSDSDQITLETFQTHLLRELHGTPYEAAFDVMSLQQRPLLVSVAFGEPAEKAGQSLAALADRCFAAAYFRYLGIA